jgi:hypothetical protein
VGFANAAAGCSDQDYALKLAAQFRLTPQVAIRHLINGANGVDRPPADTIGLGELRRQIG